MAAKTSFRGSFTALVTPFKNGSARRKGVPRPGRLADRRGHQRPGAGRHHGREPDALARRAQAGGRMVRRAGQGPGAGDRRRRLELDRRGGRACPSTPRRPAPTRCWSSRPITTSRRRKGSTSTSRRSTTPSASRSSSTTFPARSIVDMSVDTMKRLYELKNIAGVKDATANMARVSQQRAAMGADFNQLSGEDITALGFKAHGGHGCISVTSNVAPRLCSEFQAACLQGRLRHRAQAAGQARAAAHQSVRRDQPGAGQVRDVADRQVRRTRCGCRWCRRREKAQAAVREAMVHAGLINYAASFRPAGERARAPTESVERHA